MQQDSTIVSFATISADSLEKVQEAGLPLYYRESFFSESPYFHTEVGTDNQGVAGDPVPYSIAGDNLVTALLLGCFVLSVVYFARLKDFIFRQLHNLFRLPHGNVQEFSETSGELLMQLFLIVQTCLLFALLYFFHANTNGSDAFLFDQYLIIGFYAGIFLLYFLLKMLLYQGVGWVFFNPKKNGQWIRFFLFLVSFEGILIFPLVLLQSFFSLSTKTVAIYVASVVIFVKILSFYRTYIIFFNQKSAFIKNILYLCALEIVPLFYLWGILTLMSESLKVNF